MEQETETKRERGGGGKKLRSNGSCSMKTEFREVKGTVSLDRAVQRRDDYDHDDR